MKKTLNTEILDKLKRFSPRIRIIFIEAYLRSDYAGIVDLTENEEVRKNLSTLKLFSKSIITYKDKLIFTDCIPWSYVKLRDKYNPHSKVRAAIESHGLSFDYENQRFILPNTA